MSPFNWILIAGGAIVLAQSLGLYDFSKLPVIGPFLISLGIAKGVTPAPVVITTDGKTVVVPNPEVNELVDARCLELTQHVQAIQIFGATEHDTETATQILKACEVVTKAISDFHKAHAAAH